MTLTHSAAGDTESADRNGRAAACTVAAVTTEARVAERPLGLREVEITGGFWRERQDANRAVSIPDGLRQLHEAKNIRNFQIAAGRAEGEAVGPIFADSDLYKWLEAAAWEYARAPEPALLASQFELTELVAAAQEDDGYLNTVVRLREGERYRHLAGNHEHYCAGHLFQAAVAQKRCTGRDDLLQVAIRFADHLVRTFGPGKREEVDGHPVVELGLVELYRETGDESYLALAEYFVDARGHGLLDPSGGNATYFSDRVPVREATTVEGHAVRAVYLAAGAADVAIERGDPELLASLERQHESMVTTKQHVTGGLGARWEGEAFGDPYELPSDRAYAETCAAIGGVQWAWRMLLATGEARYGDQIERLLYNAFIPGVSLHGGEYFYVNPLQLRHDAHADNERSPAHGRRGWFDCACCPPNIMRTLSSLAGYLATSHEHGLAVHQYADARVRSGDLELAIETTYPWNGTVRATIVSAPADARRVAFRVPSWAHGATVDGQPVEAGGYAVAQRVFGVGDVIVLELPMRPRITRPHPRVDAVRGSVAIERGPLVYALEAPDQPDGVVLDDLVLDRSVLDDSVRDDSGALAERPFPEAEALGAAGMVAIGALATDPDGNRIPVTAIPYFAWANRGPRQMRVWIREA
ncbi:MAG TPA: beta-L-arabinofuranosidase domain-containing protein [Humibacter sp.]|nr:beta-L-arabinofuranosidase domain-containing protein [Humibacter sp.]